MRAFYVTIQVSHTRIAEIFNDLLSANHGKSIDPESVVGNPDYKVKVVFEESVKAFSSYPNSRSPFRDEITKQLNYDRQYGSEYTPSVVMDIQPYVCLKFERESNATELFVKRNESIECIVVDVSLYFKKMSYKQMCDFIYGAQFVRSKYFTEAVGEGFTWNKDLTEGVGKVNGRDDITVIHGLKGTVIRHLDRVMTLTCGYRCIFLSTKDEGTDLFEHVSSLWYRFVSKHPKDPGSDIGSVNSHNNTQTNIYIMLGDYKIDEVMTDSELVKALLRQ